MGRHPAHAVRKVKAAVPLFLVICFEKKVFLHIFAKLTYKELRTI